MNLDDILSFVLPKVRDNRQAEAMQVLKQTFEPEPQGILRKILNMVRQRSDAPDAASMLSVLLTMVKPEHIADIQNFFTALFSKNSNQK